MTRLFIATPSFTLAGGVERILESLARQLPSRGFDVRFGVARGARFHDAARFMAAFPSMRGVELDARSGTAYGRRRALRRAISAFDPDVVLIARIFDAYSVSAELKAEGHRLRLVTTLQALEPEYFADLARYADVVDFCVTSGNLLAEAVQRATTMPRDRVRSVAGGVAPPSRLVVHDTRAPLRIGYVGRIEQTQKRVLDLIDTVAELDRRGVEFQLTIAGSGASENDLRNALPRATFLGWRSAAELYESVYPQLDVLVHFAAWEGITIAPREAMAHGVVPVISRFPGLVADSQFVDGLNALTFEVGNARAAADCIERLHRDRSLLARLSFAARASQGGERSEDGAIDAWADVFRTAIALPQRRGAFPPPPRDRGLLSRRWIPEGASEVVRRLRRLPHADAGSEWPHWSGVRDENIWRIVEELARTGR
jgi:glycosyltransferase involved in cell wall biosynthesis